MLPQEQAAAMAGSTFQLHLLGSAKAYDSKQ